MFNVVIIFVLAVTFAGELFAAPAYIIINRSHTEKKVAMSKNHHLATFEKVGKEYAVSFEFVPEALSTGWRNVFHMSSTNTDCCARGSRLPAVWFRRENDVSWIFVGSDINENGDYDYVQPEPSIQVGKKVTVRIQQDLFGSNYLYTISINGKVVWGVYNGKATEFAEVKLYCSSPWYPGQVGEMTNLAVSSS